MDRLCGATWGSPFLSHQKVVFLTSRIDAAANISALQKPFLVYGGGNSYGDVCSLREGVLIDTRWLNKFISFDEAKGQLRCEAGVSIGDIQQMVMPRGWCLPVMPGTQHVTVGGAVANDVHGKNHHVRGTFGCHVLAFTLIRSDGKIYECSQNNQADLYHATIGGLGLTGVIMDVTIQLIPCSSAYLDVEKIPFSGLTDYFQLLNESKSTWEFLFAWLDCVTRHAGRGFLIRANFSDIKQHAPVAECYHIPYPFRLNLITRPVNNLISAFLYYKNRVRQSTTQPYSAFFYPLDTVKSWSKFYGNNGLYQFQCVIPLAQCPDRLHDIIQQIRDSKLATFLSSLKLLSSTSSPGLLSFPREGISLAVDFAACQDSQHLIERLCEYVQQIGGRIYPAKDSLMTRDIFQATYANLEYFRQCCDPGICSDFANRLIFERENV